MISRRELLRQATAAAIGGAAPGWLLGRRDGADPRRIVVLIELRGGNDGLNTVAPIADPLYRRLRPTLALGTDQVLPLSRELGLHRGLAALEPAWRDGDLALVLGLGHPDSHRSHLRGIGLWDTAAMDGGAGADGWLARLGVPASGALADGMVLGRRAAAGPGGSGPLAGGNLRVLVLDPPAEDTATPAGPLAALERMAPSFAAPFPASDLGRQLEFAARLIVAGAGVPAWKLTLDGFDTHAHQLARHGALLATLGDALAAFRCALGEAGWWDRVLVMTYSEFGRRSEENASRGSDHGGAAPHLVLGGKVRGGFHGHQPDLLPDGGGLARTTDFRALYRAIAEGWWGCSGSFLDGAGVPALSGLIRR